MTIAQWLKTAAQQLREIGVDTARLDVEVILAHTIRESRTYLHAHGDEELTDRQQEIADARLLLRLDRVPVAYIIGHKEFYGRRFKVNTGTLIPRPESEAIIESLKEIIPPAIALIQPPLRLVDVGTGSGALGITAKLEVPELDVTLVDISRHALTVAESNAKQLGVEVTILQSDLLDKYPFQADIILANLPYVNPNWSRSPETKYEPGLALFADDNGLALINRLLTEAPGRLNRGGHLILEADLAQHEDIIKTAKDNGFELVRTNGYSITLKFN